VRTIIAKASRGPVTVHYLGRIYYAYRKAYSKRSPRGELEIIPAARILRLKPSKQLKHKAK
jgi:nucleoid DNA-binding protein